MFMAYLDLFQAVVRSVKAVSARDTGIHGLG